MKIKLFSYAQLDTVIHKLSGLTKLLCFLFLTTAVMMTYDIRIITVIMIFSFACFKVAKIQWKQVKVMFIYVFIFLITNFILTFIFAPQYGVELYGTKHVIFEIVGPYVVTQEQLYYQAAKFLKYLSVIPLGLIFFFTTNPSEFASSLNSIGIPYKICTTLALTLRYFPDIQRDYNNITLAQQARGIDMSRKEKLMRRFKNILSVLIPLIFSTLDRVEVITNAMTLRGYGKSKHRSWYSFKNLATYDYIALVICMFLMLFTLYMRFFVVKGMFYNPFI